MRPGRLIPPISQDKGVSKLVAANVGDARILLVKGKGKAPVQLTFDHVPDEEVERNRIEKFNPVGGVQDIEKFNPVGVKKAGLVMLG